MPAIHFQNSTQTVLVVTVLFTTFNLVVSLLSQTLFRVLSGVRYEDVAVQPRTNAAAEGGTGNQLAMRDTLRGVEVGRSERQEHFINRHELAADALLLVVAPELLVLATAHRQLGQQLFQLVTVLLNLGRQLPVHEARLAVGFLKLLGRYVAIDPRFNRARCREQLLDGTRRKINAGFGQHGVHDTRRTIELSTTRGIVAKSTSAQSFFILLVALLAGLLVRLDQLTQFATNGIQRISVDDLSKVVVKVRFAGRTFILQRDFYRAILVLDVLFRHVAQRLGVQVTHFFFASLALGILAPARRATSSAMAIACFWGLPAAISVRMFLDTAALDLLLINGMIASPSFE